MKGSGRKPHPQKGTGRARLGSRRAPQVKGGKESLIIILNAYFIYI